MTCLTKRMWIPPPIHKLDALERMPGQPIEFKFGHLPLVTNTHYVKVRVVSYFICYYVGHSNSTLFTTRTGRLHHKVCRTGHLQASSAIDSTTISATGSDTIIEFEFGLNCQKLAQEAKVYPHLHTLFRPHH